VTSERSSTGCHRWRRNPESAVKQPSSTGTAPVSWLCPRNRFLRAISFLSSDGTAPVNWLSERYNPDSAASLPSFAGTPPVRSCHDRTNQSPPPFPLTLRDRAVPLSTAVSSLSPATAHTAQDSVGAKGGGRQRQPRASYLVAISLSCLVCTLTFKRKIVCKGSQSLSWAAAASSL